MVSESLYVIVTEEANDNNAGTLINLDYVLSILGQHPTEREVVCFVVYVFEEVTRGFFRGNRRRIDNLIQVLKQYAY